MTQTMSAGVYAEESSAVGTGGTLADAAGSGTTGYGSTLASAVEPGKTGADTVRDVPPRCENPQQAGTSVKAKRIARPIWAALGFTCFGLGAAGVAIPLIPTTPFMLLAAFCFARSSSKLNAWFKSTRLYKSVLENYSKKGTMTVKAKLAILGPVTALLAFAFIVMANAPVGRAVVALVWFGNIVYFGFIVKTERKATQAVVREPAPPHVGIDR